MTRFLKEATILGLLLALTLTSLAQAAPARPPGVHPSGPRSAVNGKEIRWCDLVAGITATQDLSLGPAYIPFGGTVTNDAPITFHFRVKNRGNRATTFRYHIAVGNGFIVPMERDGVMRLKPNETRVIRYTLRPTRGRVYAAIQVDGGSYGQGQVDETCEVNNSAGIKFWKE